MSLSAAPIALVSPSASWRYLPGLAEASAPDATAWRTSAFDDSTWKVGAAPFFYGQPFTGTELADMSGRYTSVYLRGTVMIAEAAQASQLNLQVLGDDGYIVWINGREVARFNVPEGELAFDAVSLPALPEPLAYEEIAVREPWTVLVDGANQIAIQAFNAARTGPDFALAFSAELERDTVAPTVTEVVPPPNSTLDELVAVEVFFSEPVTGIDAGDLLVNGAGATSVKNAAPGHYVFSFPQPAAGEVQFRWRDGHDIRDVVGRPNPFAGGTWVVRLDPAASRHNLRITEFMADNDQTLFDDDCEPSDWIEIYNSGVTTVNLSGWALTDEPANPGKWRFPEYDLSGGSYLVVFASQKNKTNLPTVIARACQSRTNRLAGFHTNFRLSNNGEYLALTAPDGEMISALSPAFPAQRRDVSYGLVPGTTNFAFSTAPTPGRANASSGTGFTPEVTFSRDTGTYQQDFELSLRCADTNAVIRYTLDGSFPSEGNGALVTYRGPIPIRTLVQVRARAWAPGLLPGNPTSETYLRLTDSAPQLRTLTSSLPIIVITTLKPAAIPDSGNRPVHLSFYEPVRGLTSLTNPPTLTTRGGLKTRGSSTGAQPQSNFAVDLWDEFDQDHDLSPFGMPEDSEWVLYAPNGFDAALIHNPFTMELSRQMGSAAPRTRFVEVYLNKGGPLASNQWFGLYVWMEKPGLSKGRINAPKAQPEDVLPPDVTGSYLFKTDRLDPGDTGFAAGGAGNAYVEPKEREMRSPQRAPQLAYLGKYFRDMDAALRASAPDFRDPVRGYKAYLDTTNWVDFHLLEMLSGQADAIRLSTYFYKRRNGRIEYGPRWDYDRGWESKDDSRDDNPRVWDTGGGLWGPPWFGALFRDVDAWQVWVDRWQGFRRTTLSLTNMHAVIDQMTNEIRGAQPRENVRWRETAPRISYANEIRIMKTWISNRLAWVDGQLAQPPTLSSPGAAVTPGYQLTLRPPASVSNPANVAIYYTLDGSDPRPSRGTGNITGFRYEGPITITTNSRVFARTRDTGRIQRSGPPSSTPWSSAVLATFVVTPPRLALTEIMFHPAATGLNDDPEAYEYLELRNLSDTTVALEGYHFTAGIEFRFTAASGVKTLAPGDRVLVVKNQVAFQQRYPGVGAIAGEFVGTLSNAGERLSLAGPVEEPIFSITYGDSWQPLADGLGFSLVPVNDAVRSTDGEHPENWRLSSRVGGSPGTVDPTPVPAPRVVVSEVQPLSPGVAGDARVELQNLDPRVADISGWWLSDDFKDPRKVRMPPNSRVPASGFLVVPESVFNLPNGAGFGLSSKGDAFWIFSADAEGNLTGWHHGFTFGVSDSGQSFGLLERRDGTRSYPLQREPSLGTANLGPQIGPVVVGEIMYQPPDDGSRNNVADEYVEVRNVAAVATPLFDAARGGSPWRLRGGVELEFPPNLTLDAGGRIYLVGFDPLTQPEQAASLRRRAGLEPGARMLGSWTGNLGNLGGSVRLERPGIPVADGAGTGTLVPYLIADEVNYLATAPWPQGAAGSGAALLRRANEEYGDDPQNWLALPRLASGGDADADGLPDAWETVHRLNPRSAEGNDGPEGDPDGDHFTNRQEFVNGTDPGDPLSKVRLGVSYGAGDFIHLRLAAPTGSRVLVESRPALSASAWTGVREVTVGTGVTPLVISLPAPTQQAFFRAVVR